MLKALGLAVVLMVAAAPVQPFGPTPAEAGVRGSIKGAAKSVGGAVKRTAKGIGSAAKAGAAVGKQVGVGVARDVKGAAVQASRTGVVKGFVRMGKSAVSAVGRLKQH
jgi:hypothetical protein